MPTRRRVQLVGARLLGLHRLPGRGQRTGGLRPLVCRQRRRLVVQVPVARGPLLGLQPVRSGQEVSADCLSAPGAARMKTSRLALPRPSSFFQLLPVRSCVSDQIT